MEPKKHFTGLTVVETSVSVYSYVVGGLRVDIGLEHLGSGEPG